MDFLRITFCIVAGLNTSVIIRKSSRKFCQNWFSSKKLNCPVPSQFRTKIYFRENYVTERFRSNSTKLSSQGSLKKRGGGRTNFDFTSEQRKGQKKLYIQYHFSRKVMLYNNYISSICLTLAPSQYFDRLPI